MSTKYQAVADALRAHIQAGKYAGAAVLPSEFAIAEEYQVSRQTVRQALSLLAQDGLIETKRGSGSHILRTAKAAACHYNIAVIVTYISDYVFPSILREVEDVLSRQECTSSIFATQNRVANERKILTRLLEQPVDGVLVEATKSALPNPNLDLYRQLTAKNIPLVFIHGYYADLPESHFVLDANYDGGLMLARYLADQGCTRIGGATPGTPPDCGSRGFRCGTRPCSGSIRRRKKLCSPGMTPPSGPFLTACWRKWTHFSAITMKSPTFLSSRFSGGACAYRRMWSW